MVRSHLRIAASVIGAAAISSLALAPALAATVVSQSGANAITLQVAGNGQGTGNVTATNDGSKESTTGETTPPISVLKGQQVLNAGVLAQQATARADSTSAACSGLAGNGGSVAQVGDSSCLTPGTPVSAGLGSLDLSKLVVADPASALAPLNDLAAPILAQVQGPLTDAVNQAVEQARGQFGDLGLTAGFGVVEGRCTAGPGTASGSATLADAGVKLQVPGRTLTLLDLPVDPAPNTHLTTNLSQVATLVLDAVRTDLTNSLDGQAAGLTAVTDAIQQQIVDNVLTQVEGNLAPLEQNVLDITLNQQVRPTDDSIKVRALDLKVLPVAQEQLGAPLVDLQVGNAACGPAGRIVPQQQAAPPAAPKPATPTAVSAGLESLPGQHAAQRDSSAKAIALGAFAVLSITAAGFLTRRRWLA